MTKDGRKIHFNISYFKKKITQLLWLVKLVFTASRIQTYPLRHNAFVKVAKPFTKASMIRNKTNNP